MRQAEITQPTGLSVLSKPDARQGPNQRSKEGQIAGLFRALVMATAGLVFSALPGFAQSVHLVPHKAVYELKLGKSASGSPVSNVAGRIIFQTTGNICVGYDTEFRFLAAITDSGNDTNTTDLISKTHESGDGRSFSFSSQTTTGGKVESQYTGKAELKDGKTVVTLTKPDETDFSFDQELMFPNIQMSRLVAAALSGQNVVPAAVYDASTPVDKAYRTISVIGARVSTDLVAPRDASKAEAINAIFKGHAHWPVVVSYFPLAAKDDSSPDHIISFDLLDNGISGKMLFDYGDFTIDVEISSLELLPEEPCTASPASNPPAN